MAGFRRAGVIAYPADPAVALPRFLADAAAKPFQFGDWDCVITLANWIAWRTGVDVAADIRGTYSDDAGWVAIVLREGGMANFISGRAAKVGWVRKESPELGDIGLLRTRDNLRVGGIWDGRRFWAKIGNGITGAPMAALRVWGP